MDTLGVKMKLLAVLMMFSMGCVIFLITGPQFLQENQENLFESLIPPATYPSEEQENRMNFFYTVWEIVDGVFPGWNEGKTADGVSWMDMRLHYEEVLSDDTLSRESFLYLVQEMLGLLGDPLTGLTHETLEGVLMTLPVSVSWQDNTLVLDRYSGIFRSMPSYLEYMERGDQLVMIDGLSAALLFEGLWENHVYALGQKESSEKRMSRDFFLQYYQQRLRAEAPVYAYLTFQKRSGLRYTLRMNWLDARGLMGYHGILIEAAAERSFSVRRLSQSDLAYIRPGGLGETQVAQWQSALNEFRDARGLIVDLRSADPGDGYMTFAQVLLGSLTSSDLTYARIYTRDSALLRRIEGQEDPGTEELIRMRHSTVSAGSGGFDGPVAFLISDDVLQPPDELLWGIAALDQTVMIGRPHSLDGPVYSDRQVIVTPYAEWAFGVSTARWENMAGDSQEQTPIIFVPLSDEELQGSTDDYMTAAIRWFHEGQE